MKRYEKKVLKIKKNYQKEEKLLEGLSKQEKEKLCIGCLSMMNREERRRKWYEKRKKMKKILKEIFRREKFEFGIALGETPELLEITVAETMKGCEEVLKEYGLKCYAKRMEWSEGKKKLIFKVEGNKKRADENMEEILFRFRQDLADRLTKKEILRTLNEDLGENLTEEEKEKLWEETFGKGRNLEIYI